mgnify:CR=1 FL=1
MGGHCEPGGATSRPPPDGRRSRERAGSTDSVLLPGPVDLDIHVLQCPKGHPNRHLDVRWLAVAPAGRHRPAERRVARPPLVPSSAAPPPDADESTLRRWGWPRRGAIDRASVITDQPSGPHRSLLHRRERAPPGRAARATHGAVHPWRRFQSHARSQRATVAAAAAGRRRRPLRDGGRLPFVTLAGVTPETSAEQGYALIDWIADYLDGVERLPRDLARPEPGWSARPAPRPTRRPRPSRSAHGAGRPRPRDRARPRPTGSTRSFFAYFPCNTSYPSILGELAERRPRACNGMLWATEPGVHRARRRSCSTGWPELLGLPDRFRSTGAGRRRHPGHGVEATLVRHPRQREAITVGR